MNKKSKRTLTPKLRFPEFRKAPGWGSGIIADIANVLQGYGFPDKHQGLKSGEYPFYKVSDISNSLGLGKVFIEESANYVDAGLLKTLRAKPIPEGTTIFAKIGEAIRSNRRVVTTRPCLIDNNSAGVKMISGRSTDMFVYFLMETIPLIDYAGGVIPAVNKSAIENISIAYPDLTEQQRIAECLSSLDGLIAAEGRKLAALRDHKRGLMQQLFPQPGQSQPRLRFPKFRNKGEGEWEERMAGTLFANRINKGEDGLPIYSVTMHDGMVRRDSFDRNYYDIKEAAGNKKACKDDIAYNMMRMWQGALGVAPEDCLVSPAYIVLTPQKDVVSRFFEYMFKLPTSLLLLTAHSRGLTKDRLRLYYDDFARIPLRCPSKAEQHRIAACLTALDTQLAAQAAKIESLKTHKRGLMQQLFPAPEENEA